ncbi:hypothetical protein GLOIN_2v1775126 [Rhizophagus irregularis DAOM 181602=DAOM 197198]|nr:hypothetical protein GLOIN_2v1775126 [Rhizophagus irregularis DAOM 181602=DAOM 197198]
MPYRKNRVEAYDLAQELNNQVASVSIQTGILPSKNNESDEEGNDGEDDVNAIIKLIEKEDQKDLEDVICPIKNVYDEIVKTVRPNSSADDLQNEEEIIPVISLTEALINVEI